MPEVAAKQQHVAGLAQHRLGCAAMPLCFARLRFAPGEVAAGDHQRRAEVGVDVVQIQVRGADLHRQFEGGIGQQAFRQLHGQVVGMQLAADKARAAAPGGLADDMAVRPECRLGQFDHPGQIEKAQPERRAIEHAKKYKRSSFECAILVGYRSVLYCLYIQLCVARDGY